MLGLYFVQDTASSAFQITLTNGVLSVLWLWNKHKGKENMFASRLQMGFPVSVVVSLHPAFTCESMQLPLLVLKAVKLQILISITDVEWMCCTYRWNDWPRVSLSWPFFVICFFSSELRWLFFLGSLDLLPSGVLILSLVIADINYYYLFLLFDLTFIVKYFQILIKKICATLYI